MQCVLDVEDCLVPDMYLTCQQDLADFWLYDIAQRAWQQLSCDTERDGGPCGRSCHKICFDSVRKQVRVAV